MKCCLIKDGKQCENDAEYDVYNSINPPSHSCATCLGKMIDDVVPHVVMHIGDEPPTHTGLSLLYY